MTGKHEIDESTLKQNIEKQREGDHELAQKPGVTPAKGPVDRTVLDPDVKELQKSERRRKRGHTAV
jgi:hypothetical protein